MKNILLQKMNFIPAKSFRPDPDWPEKDYTLETDGQISLLTLTDKQIYSDYLREFIEANLIIFASKHTSATGKKTLLVHTTGLWGKDTTHGGREHELAFAPAYALTKGYELIKQKHQEYQLDEYVVGLEATHHGPTALKSPILFIETGGSISEWKDLQACELLVDVIIELIADLSKSPIEDRPTIIGIGGGHYAPSFLRRLNEKKYFIGHIAPKFVMDKLDEEFLKQAWDKTVGKEKLFLIDKKGSKGSERRRIIEILEELKLPWAYSKTF